MEGGEGCVHDEGNRGESGGRGLFSIRDCVRCIGNGVIRECVRCIGDVKGDRKASHRKHTDRANWKRGEFEGRKRASALSRCELRNDCGLVRRDSHAHPCY
jgi:hypothetical protein